MARIVNTTSTVTLYPTGYTGSSGVTFSGSYPVTNGYNHGAESASQVRYWPSTRSTTGYFYYTFNDPEIPNNATITSITVRATGRLSSTSSNNRMTAQAYAGTVAKGSSISFTTTTSSTKTLSVGSWTASELSNIRLRLSTYHTSTTVSGRYARFYGTDVTIDYSISTTAYTIAASSNASNATISPANQEIYLGEDADEIRIDVASIDDIVVTDNGEDVTANLIRHDNTAGSFTTSFIPSSFDETNSVYNHTAGDNGVYSTNYINNGLTDHNSTTRCALYSVRSNGMNSKMYYNFDCSSIPANAIITSVTCSIKGGSQGSTYYSNYQAYLCSGTTIKTAAVTVDGSNSSPSTEYISGGSWTRAELQNVKILFQVTANSSTEDSTWSFFGATLNVSYTVPATNPYYWTYELYNVNADHVILIDEAGVFIPPEEDPTETYWPITISSINATTSPPNGTTRVIEGTNHTITITPLDPQLTLALDNGVDITNQLVGGIPTNTYTITPKVSGASYGFNLNNNTGYYVSTNNGVNNSASVARLNLDFESDCLVTIQYINYAEANYDYGMFGKLDTEVATTGLTAGSNSSSPSDSTSNYQLAMASNSSSPQTITYQVPMGQHYIDIKYGKDDASESGNDNLQWKVLNIEATSTGGDYTYTISNIHEKHSLIFVFGNVSYYFVTSSGTPGARLFPDGQQVKLEGDSYHLNIVPDDTGATVTITDNNIDVTSSLEYNSDYKNGVLVVSYTYKLTNIQATHNLIVTIGSVATKIYLKENGT
jgi:hypothetical protein